MILHWAVAQKYLCPKIHGLNAENTAPPSELFLDSRSFFWHGLPVIRLGGKRGLPNISFRQCTL